MLPGGPCGGNGRGELRINPLLLKPCIEGGKIRLYSAMLLHRIGIDERFDDSKLGNFKLSGTCPVGAKRNSRRD